MRITKRAIDEALKQAGYDGEVFKGDACDDEAADILNNLRETEMPPAAALAQARSLRLGKAIEMRSASAVFVVRNDKGGVQWQREHRK